MTHFLNQPTVIDGIIQGKDLRIVLKAGENLSALNLDTSSKDSSMTIEPVPPRFEDAFVDASGGGPGGGSVLADLTPQVPPKSEAIIEANQLVKRFGSFTVADHIR